MEARVSYTAILVYPVKVTIYMKWTAFLKNTNYQKSICNT